MKEEGKEGKIGFFERNFTKLDNWMFGSSSETFESHLYSIMCIGICSGIGLGIIVYGCSMFGVSETALQWIAGGCLLAVLGVAIFVLLDNIKSISSVVTAILYVLLHLVVLALTLAIGVYLLVLAIILVVLYVVLWFMTGGGTGDRPDEVTLDDGTKLRKKTGLFSDGDTYEATGLFSSGEYVTKDGKTFTKK